MKLDKEAESKVRAKIKERFGKKQKEPSLAESFRESFENPTFILSSITVGVCALRFLFDGVAITILGQRIEIPHTDSLAYGSILTPVLAAHGYLRANAKVPHVKKEKVVVDNPDQESDNV